MGSAGSDFVSVGVLQLVEHTNKPYIYAYGTLSPTLKHPLLSIMPPLIFLFLSDLASLLRFQTFFPQVFSFLGSLLWPG